MLRVADVAGAAPPRVRSLGRSWFEMGHSKPAPASDSSILHLPPGSETSLPHCHRKFNIYGFFLIECIWLKFHIWVHFYVIFFQPPRVRIAFSSLFFQEAAGTGILWPLQTLPEPLGAQGGLSSDSSDTTSVLWSVWCFPELDLHPCRAQSCPVCPAHPPGGCFPPKAGPGCPLGHG